MKFYAPFAKVDADQRIVSGYASTEALDSQNEVVKREALERALPDYMKFGNIREMHQPSAVGIAVSAKHDDTGLLLEAKIVDPLAWEKVKEGVYKGFSIGGRVTNRDKVNKSIITGLHLTEISLVDRPANPEALFDVWKADGIEQEAGDLSKGMMAVGMLSNIVEQVRQLSEHSKIEEAKEGDTDSIVPGELQTALSQLMQTLNDMVAEETSEIADGTALECASPFMGPLYLGATNVDVEKKDYSEADRKDMASDGRAMKDGSYPIANRDDLENAIKAIGRAKNKAEARAHIEHRAKELGLTDLLPDGWADKADLDTDMEKTGRRNSASDQDKLNSAHDAIVAAGAECGAMKHEAPSDLAKANADLVTALAKAQTLVAELEGSVASATAAHDDATTTLADLTKAHATLVDQRDELNKRHEALVEAKTAADAELTTLKAELETIKAQPEPMKGRVVAVAKGEDVNAASAASGRKLPSANDLPKDRPPVWFGTRPTGESLTG